MRYRSQGAVLRAYCRAMGDVAVEEVRPECVQVFINGTGPVTARWMECYRVLGGLYRYAIGREFAATSPLPTDIPKIPPPLTPYIYSGDELKRLLVATDTLQTPLSPLRAMTMRCLLLLLYGTGMRIGEALSLTLKDVDLEERLLTVRNTKFYKTRLVPIGPRLTMALADYLSRRRRAGRSRMSICANLKGHWVHLVIYFSMGCERDPSVLRAVLHGIHTFGKRGGEMPIH